MGLVVGAVLGKVVGLVDGFVVGKVVGLVVGYKVGVDVGCVVGFVDGVSKQQKEITFFFLVNFSTGQLFCTKVKKLNLEYKATVVKIL